MACTKNSVLFTQQTHDILRFFWSPAEIICYACSFFRYWAGLLSVFFFETKAAALIRSSIVQYISWLLFIDWLSNLFRTSLYQVGSRSCSVDIAGTWAASLQERLTWIKEQDTKVGALLLILYTMAPNTNLSVAILFTLLIKVAQPDATIILQKPVCSAKFRAHRIAMAFRQIGIYHLLHITSPGRVH
jgi:hypothetical protein